jgi:hypothetical protein
MQKYWQPKQTMLVCSGITPSAAAANKVFAFELARQERQTSRLSVQISRLEKVSYEFQTSLNGKSPRLCLFVGQLKSKWLYDQKGEKNKSKIDWNHAVRTSEEAHAPLPGGLEICCKSDILIFSSTRDGSLFDCILAGETVRSTLRTFGLTLTLAAEPRHEVLWLNAPTSVCAVLLGDVTLWVGLACASVLQDRDICARSFALWSASEASACCLFELSVCALACVSS